MSNKESNLPKNSVAIMPHEKSNLPGLQSNRTHAGAITWSWKPRRDKDLKMEDSISGWADQTQTLLHYTVYALSNTRMEILNFFGNWIIIFVVNYLEFRLFSAFCSKNFVILRLFTNILLSWNNLECEISGDLKKILERRQHCFSSKL